MAKQTFCRTGKKQYQDRIAALNALAVIEHQDKPGHDEKRVYRCRFCKKFHLTSQE